ncbi:MAG: hypothetical protein JETT_1979 [Candidatus Jettenia ecosi]|uniref:PIN domain-containing protein n=1 Tax=Candidatus Jettenia ecosi TaxID=2494326 RepID=A0A533QAM8_9BACT|nr:MAG: hypothetical protein JETT_1979 [Candidatus Jettenia ecosi]
MGEKTKVVIDTNVIVSAFGWGGKPADVIRLITSGKILNFTSSEMFTELKKVVGYPRLAFSETSQAEIMEIIFNASSIVDIHESVNIIDDDAEDNKILECAISAGAEFVISGDKHLLTLKSFEGIKIVTPEDFIETWSLKK